MVSVNASFSIYYITVAMVKIKGVNPKHIVVAWDSETWPKSGMRLEKKMTEKKLNQFSYKNPHHSHFPSWRTRTFWSSKLVLLILQNNWTYIVTYLSENLCPKEIQSFSIKTLMRKSKIHFTTPFNSFFVQNGFNPVILKTHYFLNLWWQIKLFKL